MTQIAVTSRNHAAWTSRRGKLWHMLGLARQRRALARLDDRALKDIGVTRQDAQAEAARPLWDAPDNWLKQLY